MSNITLNIVEPSSPTPINPVDPGTGTAVPDTGLFTHGIGGAEAAIIATITLVAILAIIGAVIYHKKKAKQGSTTSLLTKCKKAVKNKKYALGLAVLALLVSIGTVAGLLKLDVNAIDSEEADSAEAQDDTTALTVTAESEELTIELADEPVFAVLPVEVTVAEATEAGYTLTAYTEDTDLVSTTDSSKTIPMVTVDATDIDEEELETESLDSSLVPLSPNTYGLSFTDPDSITDEVYTSLSTDSTAPTFITDKSYLATAANDTTTIYYGFYITPDIPYGTYTGSNISVDAIPNIATVTYNANGLYYNDEETSTENTVGYKPNIAEAPIEEVVGEYITPAPLTLVDPSTTIHYTFLGWSETQGATTPTYTNEEDILANLTLTKNESLTLYAVWHYDTVLSFDGNTSDGGSSIPDQTIAAGETITLPQNTFTRTGSVFTGWNTAADGSGEAYVDEADFTAPLSSADITLYAQWAYTTTITFSGNGADSGSMADQTIVAGTPQNLTPNVFAKDGYVFNGWNTVQTPTTENPGTAYADQAPYTASTTQPESFTLYAQWKQVFYMQDVATWGSTLSQGDTMEAVDKRDGKTYYVSRLADNKIWMTQNLDLDLKTDGSIVYDATTTNISSAWTPNRATISFTGTSVSGWSDNSNTPYSADPGPLFFYSSGTTSNDDQYTSLEACQQAHTDCSMHNHVGNYYNWSAAVAMNSTSSLTTQYSNAPGSICPAGWRLPTGRNSGNTAASREWNALLYAEGVASNPTGNGYTTDGFNKIRKSPLWLARSGNVDGGSLYSTGNDGSYWSSTVSSSSVSYRLDFGSGNVYPASGDGRSYGYSVRCIAQ